MKPKDILPLLVAVLISELAGVIGSVFTFPSVSGWYQTLQKPALNPPGWIFGPVWTGLFLLMGIAVFLVWRRTRTKGRRVALFAFGIQLALNVCWSIIFFGLHQPGWSLVEIVVLWIAILCTTVLFYRQSKPAAILFLPYLLWVTFATYLNFEIWSLNVR